MDCISICVPTPLDEHFQPDISYVEKSTRDIAKYLHKGMLVVLESTTYPGTTEEIIKPILESTGLKCEEDFYLAFSPERRTQAIKSINKECPKSLSIGKDSTKWQLPYIECIRKRDLEVLLPAVAEWKRFRKHIQKY